MLAKKLSTEEQLDEKDLLHDLGLGDYKAFTKLYECHVVPLTNYAFSFTSDIQIIEDCVHDLFVWLWNHRSQLNITHSLKAYLFKSLRTSVLAKIKKSKKFASLIPLRDDDAAFFVSGEEEYITTETRFALRGKIAGVMETLTSKQKEVVYLRFYEGLSFDEIASNMNLSTKACYKLMGRAIAELKKTCSRSWQCQFLFFLFFLNFMG